MRRSREADEGRLAVSEPDDHAAGIPGIAVALKRSVQAMGPGRSARTLLKLNQAEGFDCMSCAWPDPDPVIGTRPSSVRTAPRPSRKKPLGRGRRRSSSPATALPILTGTTSTGWGSRVASRIP